MNKILAQGFLTGKLSHAYVFEGQLEETRQMYIDFAEEIFKEEDKRDKSLGLERFYDLDIVRPEKDRIPIDVIRDIKKKVFEKPLESAYKVFVIERADCMRAEAQNALLKTLEDLPEYCIIILTTDNRNKLYDTILSRCQLISDYREEDRFLTSEDFEEVITLLQKAFQGKYYAAISSKSIIDKFKDRKKDLINQLEVFFADILVFKLGIYQGNSQRYIKYLTFFKDLSQAKIEGAILELEEINDLLRVNINFQLAFENFLFTLMEE